VAATIRSFLALSEEAEKHNDMRQADALAERAQILAKELQSGNNPYEQRRQAVAAGLPARKLDCLLVAFSPNLRYLSGFTGSSGALLILPGRSILFTDPRYRRRPRRNPPARSASPGGRW